MVSSSRNHRFLTGPCLFLGQRLIMTLREGKRRNVVVSANFPIGRPRRTPRKKVLLDYERPDPAFFSADEEEEDSATGSLRSPSPPGNAAKRERKEAAKKKRKETARAKKISKARLKKSVLLRPMTPAERKRKQRANEKETYRHMLELENNKVRNRGTRAKKKKAQATELSCTLIDRHDSESESELG